MKNLGLFKDNNGKVYTLFNVSSKQLSSYISEAYKKKYNINDFSEFVFEVEGYGFNAVKKSPDLKFKKIMLEQNFIVLNSPNEITPFNSDNILIDGFNRLLNGDVPEQDIFVKVYHNINIEYELKLYYELNAHKTYNYNTENIVKYEFVDRGFLLYLTIRTGISWDGNSRKMLYNYFDSSNYRYGLPSNKRAHLLDKMIYDNPYFIEDIKLISYLSNLEMADIISNELIMFLGSFRAYELFNNPLGGYASKNYGYENGKSAIKISGIFDKELINKFLKDELVIKKYNKLKTSKRIDDIKREMWEYFVSYYLLPHYGGLEPKLSKVGKKAKVKKEVSEIFKTMDIIKFPRMSDYETEKKYFKKGKTYKLYIENKDKTAYKIIDVVYKGVDKRAKPAGYTMTVELNCHIFYSEELKKIDIDNNKSEWGKMWDKWNRNELSNGEYCVRTGCFWNNVSKRDKMFLIVNKNEQPTKINKKG